MQMKLNKSILGIALMLVFLLGACSQARYGNLTTRTKATHLAKKEVKKEVKETPVKGEVINEIVPTLKDAVLIENDAEQLEEANVSETIAITSPSTEKKSVTTSKTAKTAMKLAGPLQKRALKKVLKKLDEKESRVQPEKADDDSSLLRLILIIILVLLIVSLLGKLIPGLDWLLGILILVVLIWLILQYI